MIRLTSGHPLCRQEFGSARLIADRAARAFQVTSQTFVVGRDLLLLLGRQLGPVFFLERQRVDTLGIGVVERRFIERAFARIRG